MRIFILCFSTLIILVTIVDADFIDFESGFVELQRVGAVTTNTNTATFAVGNGTPIAPGWIAEAGYPRVAFVCKASGDPPDTPTNGSRFSLTETDGTHPLGEVLDYFVSFAKPVSNLSLDFYDYRTPEGSVQVGNTATLTVFSDMFTTPVGFDVFTVTAGLPDGNVANLSVPSPSANIYSASLTYSDDGGTAIDNLKFDTIPEPGTMFLLGLGLLGLLGYSIHRKKKS